MKSLASVEIGWCGTLDSAVDMHSAGLDYIELQLVPLCLEDNASFVTAKAALRDLPLPAPVMSYLFPHDLRLVGPEIHTSRARSYMDRVVELMAISGAKYLVYGSGWTRNVPTGFEPARAEEQLLETLCWCAKALQSIDATLVIEPLNSKESNQCNLVADGLRLARLTRLSNVKSLVDFYHMDEERESLSILSEIGSHLAHVHLADTNRMNPGTGRYDYRTFFSNLKSSGYTGRFSGECRILGDPIAGMRESARFLRENWEGV